MDLDERLCDYIRTLGHGAEKCNLGFVPANGELSLQMDPGSKATQTYFNGNQDMGMNFELAMNCPSYPEARGALGPIADALAQLKELDSHDGSFMFDHIEITGMPFNQIIDATNNMYWITNFVCYVTQIYR